MTVSEMKHVLVGCYETIYKDRFTHKVIDYDNLNRREKERFRNRNIYLVYPKESKMVIVLY